MYATESEYRAELLALEERAKLKARLVTHFGSIRNDISDEAVAELNLVLDRHAVQKKCPD